MAKAYHVRPSELLAVSAETFLAFALDRAVWYFATAVENDMNAAEKELTTKNQKATAEQIQAVRLDVFNRYMNSSDGTKPAPGRFADPRRAIAAGHTGR